MYVKLGEEKKSPSEPELYLSHKGRGLHRYTAGKWTTRIISSSIKKFRLGYSLSQKKTGYERDSYQDNTP